jgi:hypothetical protein
MSYDYPEFEYDKDLEINVDIDFKLDADINVDVYKDIDIKADVDWKVEGEGNFADALIDVQAIGEDTFVEVDLVVLTTDGLSSVSGYFSSAVA